MRKFFRNCHAAFGWFWNWTKGPNSDVCTCGNCMGDNRPDRWDCIECGARLHPINWKQEP